MKTVGWVVLHWCVAHVDVHGEVSYRAWHADVVCLVCRSCGAYE